LRKLKDLKYDSKVKKSSNRNKTIWDIAKFETGKTTNNDNICILNNEGKLASVIIKRLPMLSTSTKSLTTSIYHIYSIKTKNNHNYCSINMEHTMPIHYLLQSFKNSFLNKNLNFYELGKSRI
jgi:hypothetical protein